jgi:serine/threonine protein kinase
LLLQSRKLWPVDPRIEQDWSDRGQHAIFQDDEQSLIDKILQVKDNLGSTRTAVVQSVQCRRILLARKTIKCGRQTMTKEEAIAEVSHLTRLNHAHILRLIGTYVKGRDLSILLYPVASCNLEEFLYDVQHTLHCSIFWLRAQSSIEQFFPCLSSAVRYIHENLTKHMDIKPQNILVETRGNITYRPYIADFGIARVYNTLEDVETNGRTSFTKRYAAPEVVRQDTRGLTADIFSLGCVFLELGDSLYPDVPELRGVKEQWKDASYQANINTLQALIARYIQGTSNRFAKVTFFAISQMIQLEPLGRPTAEQLHCVWKQNDCCIAGSVPLEAMPRPL